MTRSFPRKVASLAALLGFLLVAVLTSAGYALVSTIRVADEALYTYADELTLAWSLQEAYERKLASGRGYLIAHEDVLKHEFETAIADGEAVLAKLHEHVKSKHGIELLAESERALRDHDRALRDVMAMNAGLGEVGRAWSTDVRPRATYAREAMDAFIHYKEKLHAQAREDVSSVQQRAAWVMASTVLVAVLLAIFGGGRLLRSARRTYAVETEARAAAEKERMFFFNLLDQLPLGIVAADPSGAIMHVSRFAKTMLGDDEPPLAMLARALRGEVVDQEDLCAASKRVYSVTAGPVRDESGAIIAAVVAMVDITERKRGEKERELFIGALGHDLRNPLQAISVAAEVIASVKDVPESARKPATRIATSAQRMNQLIADLLDFARSQHGAIPITPENCELSEVAEDVIAEIKIAHPGREVRVEPQAGCVGSFDRSRMTQVFQNLIANAVEHGAPDSPITIHTGCDGDHAWARVTNRGAIPGDQRDRIFEPFRSRPTSKGLGLGLYIAHAIVEAHGGTIDVDGDDDRTTFVIKLPRRPKAESAIN